MKSRSKVRDGKPGDVRGAPGDAASADSISADLISILDTVDLPIVTLGHDFTVTRFNRAATALLGLTPSDVGRSPRDIRLLADVKGFEGRCARVIADESPCRLEVRDGARRFLLRIAPYTRSDGRIGGVVLTFTNVTAFSASIEQAIYEREYTKAILNTVTEPLVVLDAGLRAQTANRAFHEMFQVTREKTQGVPLYDLGSHKWDTPWLWTLLKEFISDNREFQAIEVEHDFPAIGRRTVLLDAGRLSREGNPEDLILLAFRDITERKQAEEAVRQSAAQFETLLNQAPLGVYLVGADFRIRAANPVALSVFGDIPDLIGRDFDEVIHILWTKEYADEIVRLFRHTLETGESYETPERAERRIDRGITEYYEWRIDRIETPDGGYGVVCYFRDITERKLAEATAAQLAAIVESSDDAIVSKDLNGIIVSWNNGAERLFGYTAVEVIGKPITILIPPGRADEEPYILERIRRGERVDHYETMRRRKDGSEIDISLTISPIRDRSGKVVGASKIARDISERKRAEEALRESEAWLAGQREALEAALNDAPLEISLGALARAATGRLGQGVRAAFYLADPEGTALRHVVGMPAAYAEAVDGFKIGPESLSCGLATHTGLPVITGDVTREPLWAPWLWLAEKLDFRGCWSFPVHTEARKFAGTFAVYCRQPREATPADLEFAALVTQAAGIIIGRDRAARALRESEERFRNMADNAPVMVWVTEPGASCVYLSKSWYEFTGQTPETGLGFGWLDATHPDDREYVGETFLAANSKREAFRLEYRLRRKDGEYRWAIDAAAPRSGPGGEFLGYVGSVIDITERKQMEAERERLLAEEQEAREMAERATRAKDEFLAVVSHELRSPLNAILGWSSLLHSQLGDDPRIAKAAETIERNGKAQLQLIEDLLDTTRIITGKLKLEFAPVELAPVISSALDTVRPAANNKGITLTMSLDPTAGQITGDPDRLRQVVWNLASNAIKFTPEGGRVWVELRRGDAGVQIVVRDTGPGIAPDLLPYVFDRFKQGDSAASRRFGGVGLGLALVKHLVELHGGGVAVESPGEGLGATFTVNLPMRAVKGDGGLEGQRAGETAVGWRARRSTRTARLDGLRALVVDDEAGARELLTITLELQGVSVECADSAEAAISAIESRFGESVAEPFDVLISDIGMPGVDGYELIRRLRAHPDERVSRIRAVALTAYARSEDRLRALKAGFYMHVPKPVDTEELTTVIVALMDGQLR